MAKRPAEPKPQPAMPEDNFIKLMLVAADFVKSCGGLEPARKALADTGTFIEHAGGVANASRALDVLENLKDKIVV